MISIFKYFETERLIVRQYTIADIDELYQIMCDSRVHIYTKDKNHPWDRTRTKEYIDFMIRKDFKSLDCFHGAVIEKSMNQLIGLCGLNPYRPKEPEIEWKLGTSFWGNGYATELGKQIIRESFDKSDIKGIYGIAQLDNQASRRVLQKIGMEYMETNIFRDHEDAFYYIKKH